MTKSNHHHHKSRSKRPDAVVFPPDSKETGPQVVDRIYKAFGMSDHFPNDCIAFCRKLTETDPADDKDLIDYTDKPFITIDNDNSMDLDQAMWISRTDNNGFLVSYALADGAYFVPAMSPLFQLALNKGGTSFYLPGKSMPMLPRQLSEDVMSLNEGVRRRALIFGMYLDKQGNVFETKFCWGVIKSRWKGTYREVSEYYDAMDGDSKQHPLMERDFTETLDLLRQVGILRRKLAAERDVVDYNRDAGSHITIDDKGHLVFAKSKRYSSENYNEQISLLCNSEGAKILDQMDMLEVLENKKDIVHPIYRTQSGPRQEQEDILESVIKNTLKAHGLDADKWCWKRGSDSIASYLNSIRSQQQSQIIGSKDQRRWTGVVRVIERQAMITNVAASFKPEPEAGHHSLKMTHYARFSSPMRELVGCFTHKELWEGHKGDFQSSEITIKSDIDMRDKVIRAARRAKAMQKRLNGAVFLHMLNLTFYKDLQSRLYKRPVRTGLLMGMDFSEKSNKTRRCYVHLDDPAIEIKVYGEDLDYHYGCRYGPQGETYGRFGSAVAIAPMSGSFNEDAEDEAPPTFRAGQRVTIRVADYAQFYGQTSRSRWIFIMDLEDEEDEDETTGRITPKKQRSFLRNSLVDRDLLGDDPEDDDSD